MELSASDISTWEILGYKKLKNIAVLDIKCDLVCACFDGKVFTISEAKELKKHPDGCRCILNGADDDFEVTRPFNMIHSGMSDNMDEVIGVTKSSITFIDWFKLCPPSFQLEYLGEFKYGLYSEHNYSLVDFVDIESCRVLEDGEIKVPK